MTDDELPPVRAFGEWDAPITDGAEWLDEVPKGLFCMGCQELIVQGENGAIMPTGFAQHRECGLRMVMGGIGHLTDHDYYCRGELGPDAGLSYRLSALLAWQHFTHGQRFTIGELETYRVIGE